MIYTQITASSPFIDLDVDLSPVMMEMFMNGRGFNLACQSRFSRQSLGDIVTEQFNTLFPAIKGCLDDHGWMAWEPKDKDAFPALQELLCQLQSRKLPRKLHRRARRDRIVVKSIQKLLCRRPDIIIRPPDKTKGFYVGNAAEFARKALKYMTDTEAYQELTNDRCPLADNFNVVKNLLQDLLKKKAITEHQLKMMLPKEDTLELAHLYFIPKPHKVS